MDASPLKRLAWLAGTVVWVLIVTSLATYSPADPPSHSLAGTRSTGEVANLVGPVGAYVADALLVMLGPGAWIVTLSAGLYLALIAFRGPVSHVGVRAIGVILLALAFSALYALVAPWSSPRPEGSGGLVAVAGLAELTSRFGSFGSALWLVLIALVGLTVAFDRWIVIVPNMLARVSGATVRTTATAAGAASHRLASTTRRIRENDIDGDERLGALTAILRRAAARARHLGESATPPDSDQAEESSSSGSETRSSEHGATAPAGRAAQQTEARREDSENAPARNPATQAAAGAESSGDSADPDADPDDTPGAPQVFDPEELRRKIAKLPVRFAAVGHRAATADDLKEIRSQRFEEDQPERPYVFPPLDLLEDPEATYSEEIEAMVREEAQALEQALKTYRIDGEVVGIDSGPVITLYQVRLAPGTKVSSIQAVASDIARSLKAVNLRIVPNTEGLDTVGVEVPNRKKEKVRLKELMSCAAAGKMKLPLFLGKDASGNPLVVDLASLPHLLIAGTTGSGKSVCMSAIIMGFLYTQKPNDLRMVLVDPKMVELSQFKDIPHLMCPVVTDMGKAAAVLEWAVQRMEERYELLAEAGCRDISMYNALGWEELKDRFNPRSENEEARIPRKLPYMVFIIDELADLIMTHKDVETSIVRIAQKARAVGIHLIIATQRPQANVVTGLIKSNMPGRLAFKVASGMDSRIVLDQKGGELLLGQGDMLMLTPRSSTPIRAQGTLVDDREIRKCVRFIREMSAPSFERQLVQLGSGPAALAGDESSPEDYVQRAMANAQEDPLFDKAVDIVLETRRGSVSLLQRRLAIGYTRASRLIEMMGQAGIIGQHKGSVAREVVMTPEEWAAIKAQAEADALAAATGTTSPSAPPQQASLFPEPAPAPRSATPAREPIEPAPIIDADADDDDFIVDDDDDEPEADAEDEAPAPPSATVAADRRGEADVSAVSDAEEEQDSDEDASEDAEDSVEDESSDEDEDSEDAEEYEYEYKYVEVDEEGNEVEVTPDDESEYELVDEEEAAEEESSDEEDEDSASPPRAPQVLTRSADQRQPTA